MPRRPHRRAAPGRYRPKSGPTCSAASPGEGAPTPSTPYTPSASRLWETAPTAPLRFARSSVVGPIRRRSFACPAVRVDPGALPCRSRCPGTSSFGPASRGSELPVRRSRRRQPGTGHVDGGRLPPARARPRRPPESPPRGPTVRLRALSQTRPFQQAGGRPGPLWPSRRSIWTILARRLIARVSPRLAGPRGSCALPSRQTRRGPTLEPSVVTSTCTR